MAQNQAQRVADMTPKQFQSSLQMGVFVGVLAANLFLGAAAAVMLALLGK